ncbi:hypothetical protein LY76DRAFT_593979 [Colletotrichum caudatum]|nr:hypothetical protein LY76DRAFT_593979 [Colletotrichum caudatum]
MLPSNITFIVKATPFSPFAPPLRSPHSPQAFSSCRPVLGVPAVHLLLMLA